MAIIKHANPCGIATGADVAEAHRKAHECDPVSAFGGVIAVNAPVSLAMAEQVAEIFTEVIVAPGYEDGAVEVLSRKPSIRLLQTSGHSGRGSRARARSAAACCAAGRRDRRARRRPAGWTLAAGDAAAGVLADLEFAWRAVRAVKSNAILLASGGATVGVGMGQVNRVDSAKLAVSRAGERAAGSVAASDAFFPFADGLQVLLDAGVTRRRPARRLGARRGGHRGRQAAGVTMYFTGTRHFFH